MILSRKTTNKVRTPSSVFTLTFFALVLKLLVLTVPAAAQGTVHGAAPLRVPKSSEVCAHCTDAPSTHEISQQNSTPRSPVCSTATNDTITITCNYSAAKEEQGSKPSDPTITLDRFEISFGALKAGEMQTALTFTNRGATAISETRTVYLALDDDSGRNYLRRMLRQVDLRKLAPGESVTFSSRFLSGRFHPGHYVFHLWIPSGDPSLEFDPRYNLLLANDGVPDRLTGLNVLADFTMSSNIDSQTEAMKP